MPFLENWLVHNPSIEAIKTNIFDLKQLTTEIECVDTNCKIFTDKLRNEERAINAELRKTWKHSSEEKW